MALTRLRVVVSLHAQVSHDTAVRMIKEGRVMINGKAGEISALVATTDSVTLDGQEIHTGIPLTYVLFNKPRGIECTMNPEIADNLLTVFRHEYRLYPVGRLDKESEGLLLMINDGKLYHEIAHADKQKEKEYYVEVNKPLTEDFLDAMRNGVRILNTMSSPCEVIPDEHNTSAFRIILKQGMNRQIRRMCHNLGYSVQRLVRTRIMHLHLGDLGPAHWRNLNEEEVERLPHKVD